MSALAVFTKSLAPRGTCRTRSTGTDSVASAMSSTPSLTPRAEPPKKSRIPAGTRPRSTSESRSQPTMRRVPAGSYTFTGAVGSMAMARSTGGSACACACEATTARVIATIDSRCIAHPLEEIALLTIRRGEQLLQRRIVRILLQRVAELGDGAVDRDEITVDRRRHFGPQ